jgi:hypothetical protein
VLGSCTLENRENKSSLNKSSCKVKILMDSIIYKDRSTWFFIIPEEPNYKIMAAFFDCKHGNNAQLDTNKKIKNCTKELVIENDSVKIYLEPAKIGSNKFEDLTLLLKDQESNYSYIDTTFYFKVK